MPVLESPLLLGLAPEHLVVPVAVERRVDVDQIDAAIRQLAQLVEIVAAVDDAGVEQRRSPSDGRAEGRLLSCVSRSGGFDATGAVLFFAMIAKPIVRPGGHATQQRAVA